MKLNYTVFYIFRDHHYFSRKTTEGLEESTHAPQYSKCFLAIQFSFWVISPPPLTEYQYKYSSPSMFHEGCFPHTFFRPVTPLTARSYCLLKM